MSETLTKETLDLKKFVRPGDNIIWGQGCGEPQTLTEALVAQRAGLGGVTIYIGASFSETLKPEHADHLKMVGFNAVGATRKLTKGGALQIIPCHIGLVSSYIEQGVVPCDVAFVQVSAALPDGTYSYGVINDYTQAMVAKARVVVAEVNDQVPQTHCQGTLHPKDIDYIVHTSRPVVALPTGPIGDIDRAMAKFAAKYIEDGTCLQIGIGGLPDAIMQLVLDRKDLGLHTGSVGDGMVELAEKGVLTNARKAIDKGVSVVGGLIGSQRVYSYAHKNPAISMRPSSYTHNGEVLSKLDKLVTINSCLEVDLGGQANAEQVGDSYLGGVGGQPEYVRAGHRSKGGWSIMALASSAKESSKIVTKLTTSVVTSPRTDIDVVITEYGAAELRAQPLPERARRLIAIAHPNFREALEREAQPIFKRGY
jgi:acyl-CoA hydrolase